MTRVHFKSARRAMQAQKPEVRSADEREIRALKDAIEAMAVYPPLHSVHARTPRGTIHTIVANGVAKGEGGGPVQAGAVAAMCAGTLAEAKHLRAAIPGDAALVWRIEPELRDGVLYARFCFEAL